MSAIVREIENLMKEYGYVLIRSNRHKVWRNGHRRVITPNTPSDKRALLNLKAELKRNARGAHDS